MIVVMKPHATEEMVQRMAARVESLGLKAHVIVGTERTVIAAIGEKRNGERETLESCEEVEKVVPILAPYKVASRETKTEPTIVQALDLRLGGGHIGVIAGPCSVESEAQILRPRPPSKPPVPRDSAAEPSNPAPVPTPSRA